MDASYQPFVSARGLSKSYRQGDSLTTVLDGVDLDIERGHSLSLFGMSGTGKSTLLNVLGGIESLDGGQLVVDGERLGSDADALAAHRRRTIGFVFQFYNLLPSLTVLENVVAGLDAMGPLPADAWQRARASLKAVGIADRAEAFPAQLSGGQQQRVAIARALVKRAPLVLADEPTGNLDPATGEQVLEVLLRQCSEIGSALVLVTHNEQIARRTSHAMTLSAGRLQAWSPA
jgi:putative ABC transport system ATP-binding protein